MRKLSSADRTALIKLAASLPVGSSERRAILAGLEKEIKADADPKSHDQNKPETYYSKKAGPRPGPGKYMVVTELVEQGDTIDFDYLEEKVQDLLEGDGAVIYDPETPEMQWEWHAGGVGPRGVEHGQWLLRKKPVRLASNYSKKASDPRPGKYRVTRERDGGISKDLGMMDLHLLSEELSEADSGNSKMVRKYGEGDTITIHDPANPDVLWTWIGDFEWELI